MHYHTLCFSILFEDKKKIISLLGELFFDRSKLNNIKLESFKTSIINWVNPEYGKDPECGKLFNFFVGAFKMQTYTVFFSNSPDGWGSMARILSMKAGCKCIQIRISTKPNSGIFEYQLESSQEFQLSQIVAFLNINWRAVRSGSKDNPAATGSKVEILHKWGFFAILRCFHLRK